MLSLASRKSGDMKILSRYGFLMKGVTSATLFSYVNGQEGVFRFGMGQEAGNQGQNISDYVSARLKAYSDPGTTVAVTFKDNRALSHSWQCSATLAGYLVELQPLN